MSATWEALLSSYWTVISESCLVVSDSLQPYELYSPWNSPGQKTGVGNLSLLQGIFPTQGSNPGLPHGSGFFTSWTIRETPVNSSPFFLRCFWTHTHTPHTHTFFFVYVCIYILFYLLFKKMFLFIYFWLCDLQDLSSPTKNWTRVTAVEAWNPDPQATRELPRLHFLRVLCIMHTIL